MRGDFLFPVTSTITLPDFHSQGIAPVVIRQVLESGEDGLALYGNRVASVSLVAIVRKSDYTSTKITYHLEDHTGQITAHYWLEEGASINSPQVAINSYARVFGSTRNTDGRRSIMIFRIEPLSSVNELTNHLLEMLYARFKAEVLSKSAVGNGKDFVNNFAAGGANTVNNGLNGLTAKQQQVYQAVKNEMSGMGINRGQLQSNVSNIPPAEFE